MAKVAVYFGLQMLHPFQIIIIGTGASRNAMVEGPSSPLPRCCGRYMPLHSLALKTKEKIAALPTATTADRDLKARPGNWLWKALRATSIFILYKRQQSKAKIPNFNWIVRKMKQILDLNEGNIPNKYFVLYIVECADNEITQKLAVGIKFIKENNPFKIKVEKHYRLQHWCNVLKTS